MHTNTLMVQGTISDAGKSLLVTALGRWLVRRGIRVAPFKPQNMALNSAVTIDGGEIGRAQEVQAYACGVAAHTDMNPVLLKPNTDVGAQVIIQGQAIGNMDAQNYHDYKAIARKAVLESYTRLSSNYDRIIVEGAGSPAEINLRNNDIANMGFAEMVDCPVILIADIDRGGVFAHIVGTLQLLSDTERERIKGFVINRFRGDIELLQSGLDWLEQTTNKPVLGVLPYLHGLHLEAEDALPRAQNVSEPSAAGQFRVIVPIIPRISNHTDFDPLRLHPQIDLQFIPIDAQIPAADLIILPGSKNVRHDLAWLNKHGWSEQINRHLRYGGKLMGICGGFQMLGKMIHDPHGMEGKPGSMPGLGLLDIETTLAPKKKLRNVTGKLTIKDVAISGYEIHVGTSTGPALAKPAIEIDGRPEGAISADNAILASYLHGLFELPKACTALLRWSGMRTIKMHDYHEIRETNINTIASLIEEHMDTNKLLSLLDLTEANQ